MVWKLEFKEQRELKNSEKLSKGMERQWKKAREESFEMQGRMKSLSGGSMNTSEAAEKLQGGRGLC